MMLDYKIQLNWESLNLASRY